MAADQPVDEETPRRDGRRRGAGFDVFVALAGYAVLGVVCGVLWWLLVDPATFTKVAGGVTMSELELGTRFDGDGWYTVLAAVAGFLSGIALTWWRDRDPRLTTVLLVLGSGVAAATMAVTGNMLGPDDPEVALAAARVGEKVPVELVVTARAVYLAWPIAALAGALMVLWSPPKERSRSEWTP